MKSRFSKNDECFEAAKRKKGECYEKANHGRIGDWSVGVGT